MSKQIQLITSQNSEFFFGDLSKLLSKKDWKTLSSLFAKTTQEVEQITFTTETGKVVTVQLCETYTFENGFGVDFSSVSLRTEGEVELESKKLFADDTSNLMIVGLIPLDFSDKPLTDKKLETLNQHGIVFNVELEPFETHQGLDLQLNTARNSRGIKHEIVIHTFSKIQLDGIETEHAYEFLKLSASEQHDN